MGGYGERWGKKMRAKGMNRDLRRDEEQSAAVLAEESECCSMSSLRYE